MALLVPPLWGATCYVAGGVLWGDLVARRCGVNIWEVGTRNPGAANVLRHVGFWQGLLVFTADASVGFGAIAIGDLLPYPTWSQSMGAVFVLLGTFYPVSYGFRGGAGLARLLGIGLALNPVGVLLAAPAGIIFGRTLKSTAAGAGLVLSVASLTSLLLFRDLLGVMLLLLAGGMVLIRSKAHRRPVKALRLRASLRLRI